MKNRKYKSIALLGTISTMSMLASNSLYASETEATAKTVSETTSTKTVATNTEKSQTSAKKIEVDYTLPWDTVLEHKAAIKYKEDADKTNTAKVFTAKIGFAQSGKQRLYFIDENLENDSVCNKVSTKAEVTTMIFDNQPIKMSRWCIAFANENDHFYYSYTPLSDDEHDSLVDMFKKAMTPIVINHNNNKFNFPVMGFTKQWKEVAKTKEQP